MNYTEVIVRKLVEDDPNRLKAIVSLVIDDNEFAVHNVKLIKGPERWFVAMPSEEVSADGNACKAYRDITHPIGSKNRAKLELAVFQQYEELMIWKHWLYGEDQYAQELEEIADQIRHIDAA